MKMLTTRRQNSLSLSGGHIISDNFSIPSYSPNAVSTIAQPFPWDETVDDINTPDIDPSFFDNAPLFKAAQMNLDHLDQMDQMEQNNMMTEDPLFLNTADQTSFTTEDTTQQSIHNSLEDNFDLSSLITQTVEITDSHSMVAPNDVLENQYIPPSTSPVLHYLEPNRSIDTMVPIVNIEFSTSFIDSLTSQSTVESFPQFSSPTHSSNSYSPALPSISYASPTPSPALSYTSTTSHSTLVSAIDGITSDTNTIDSLIETKPEPEFLQPTVINDHLYTLPSQNTQRKRKASEKPSTRQKNNMASKKSRVSKRDKQKDMDAKIAFYLDDNSKCRKAIEDMEKQIEWCKNYLFKKVVASNRT